MHLLRHFQKFTLDPTKFWNYIKTKRNQKRIPSNMYYRDKVYNNPQDILDAFSQFFGSTFINSRPIPPQNYTHSPADVIIREITEEDIRTAAKKLSSKFTSGDDGIPSFIVKDCISVFSKPLCTIFNLSLRTGIFPKMWKVAKICPILKSSDAEIISNYRPISIICNFSKLFEIVLYNHIYFQIKNTISIIQHGFVKGRSTTTNLFVLVQYLSEVLDRNGQVDVGYLDIHKAFDTIDHNLLLQKLRTMGFCDTLLLLFTDYISNRQQYVQYNGFTSKTYTVRSGVPQGSNLGPLLFLIFLNDFPVSPSTRLLLFADDIKIFKEINNLDDAYDLQRDMDRIVEHCTLNRFEVAQDKCKIMTFTRRKCITLYDYKINSKLLCRCESITDLGITFDTPLSFVEHINNSINKAFRFLGFVIRNSHDFWNSNCISVLYNSYVRSILEYGSIIWSPIYDVHIDNLEKIQRRYLKFLAYKCDKVYPERGCPQSELLKRFQILPLRIRRERTSIKFLYNILHNRIDAPDILENICYRIPSYQGRTTSTFHLKTPRTNLLIKSPIYSMCNLFNKISADCDINHDKLKNILECFC